MPFGVSEPSSPQYVAHQISRATSSVYDRGIPEEVILSQYLRIDNGNPIPSGTTLLQDHPELRARSTGPAFPVLIMLVCVPGFLLSALYLRSFRASIGSATRTRILWAILLPLLIVHMGQYALFATGFMETWTFSALFEIVIRKLGEAFPGSVAAVWVVCGGLIYLAYRAV